MKKFLVAILSIQVVFCSLYFNACGRNDSDIYGEDSQSAVYSVDNDGVNYISFGSYPQSDVTDKMGSKLFAKYIQAFPTKENNNGWTNYKYHQGKHDWRGNPYWVNDTAFMWYKDVDDDNNGTPDYRAVYLGGERGFYYDHYQTENGYKLSYESTRYVYWFKFEPIKWRILNKEDGKATIIAQMIIDAQEYRCSDQNDIIDDKVIYPNNYAYSDIRIWLNNDFYNTAFNEYEKTLINTIEVDNSVRSTNPDILATYFYDGVNDYACENTYDKIWLLSEREVTTADYGFKIMPDEYDLARHKATTAYARCQGAESYKGKGIRWWLRSPSTISSWAYNVFNINTTSSINKTSSIEAYTYQAVPVTDILGIVPALQISLA